MLGMCIARRPTLHYFAKPKTKPLDDKIDVMITTELGWRASLIRPRPVHERFGVAVLSSCTPKNFKKELGKSDMPMMHMQVALPSKNKMCMKHALSLHARERTPTHTYAGAHTHIAATCPNAKHRWMYTSGAARAACRACSQDRPQ